MSKNNAKGNVNLSKHEKILLLLEFFDKFGRWPKQREEYKGEKIGAFAHSIKTFITKISEEDYDTLEKKRFFFNTVNEKKHEKVLLLLEFFDNFGRWPKAREEYKNEKIGAFAHSINALKTKLSKEDYAILKEKNFFNNTREQKKHEKVLLLLEFFDKYSRWPKAKEEYKNEKIGTFARRIKSLNTKLSKVDYDILQKKGFFNTTRDEKKHQKFLLLLEFFDKFGRWPKDKEEYKNEKIGAFARRIKSLNTKLSRENYDTLEKKEFFNNTLEQKKHEKVLLLLEFFDKFSRWPKQKEEYKNEKIGTFACSIKTFSTKLSKEDYAILKGKKFFNNTREQKKHKKVLLLLEFFDKFGRWPKQKEEYKNEKIGKFASSIKTLDIKLSKEDYAILKEKNFFNNTREQKKHEKVLLLLEFFDKYSRWPKAKEEYKNEKIGTFANSIKTFSTKLSKEDYAILKGKKFFNNTREQKKHKKVLLLLEFFDKYGRWPKQKEEYKGEKIGIFARDIKSTHRKLSKEDYGLLANKGFYK